MWLFTKVGFFSVVKRSEDIHGILQIRARIKEDLINLLNAYFEKDGSGKDKKRKIHEDSRRDYPYRILVTPDELTALFIRLASDIDYSNFKDEVEKRQGKARHDLYLEVWSTMNGAENLLSLRPKQKRVAAKEEELELFMSRVPKRTK